MRPIIHQTATMLALILAAAPARAQQPFNYLVKAANEIQSIEHSHAVITPDDNARIAKIACDALTRLLKDDNLVRASDEIFRNVTANHRAAAQALIQNMEEFNDVFLPIELDKMRAKGFDYPAITDALQVASKTRASASIRDLTAAEVLSLFHSGYHVISVD